jgi:deazaflavin-dependent oxidoreductase (nitroreductase family)
MSVPFHPAESASVSAAPDDQPRFGGLLWRLARRTGGLTQPLAGKRWNPIFAVVLHQGRRTGRRYATPVAARRLSGGFVISLAFGAQVDWYRNLQATGGGRIRWRGSEYPVGTPEPVDVATGQAAFHSIQRLALRLGGIDRYIRVPDASSAR